jgi:hypothetical protein
MSLLRAAEPVKLLTSLFGKDVSLMTEALTLLSGRWGEVDFVSPLLPFDETDYYEKETGKDLVRRLVSFATRFRRTNSGGQDMGQRSRGSVRR